MRIDNNLTMFAPPLGIIYSRKSARSFTARRFARLTEKKRQEISDNWLEEADELPAARGKHAALRRRQVRLYQYRVPRGHRAYGGHHEKREDRKETGR